MRHFNAFTASLALHVAALVLLLSWSAARGASNMPAPVAKPIVIEWLATMPAAPPSSAPTREATTSAVDLTLDDDSSELQLGHFSFNLKPIAARADDLFPFLTDVLLLEPALKSMRRETPGSGLSSPLPPPPPDASDKPPLALSDAQVQLLVDQVWTRRERWERFQAITRLSERYDADRGQLPSVIRRYTDANVLQPYVDSSTRDPRLWVMLGLAAEHSDFLAFITRYAAEHPSSRTTTELMFLLDDLSQGSRDTLLVLLDVDTRKDLWRTAAVNRDAVQFIEALQHHYRGPFRDADFELKEAVHNHYDQVRLAILESIVIATPAGYRANDARYLIGAIHWKRRETDEALRWWREMTVVPTDRHVRSYSEIIDAVHASQGADVDGARIDRALRQQRARWVDFWYTRLRQFGFRADTF